MNYTFDNIAGYEKEKSELMRLCEIFNNREKYEAKGAKLPKGIIFYGGAGTGKTLFAKVMASACGLETFSINLGKVENESEICKLIRKTFAKAEKHKEPTMIFFDELDKFLPNPDEDYSTDRSKTILSQLLTLIDGMDSVGNIVFVATCNRYSVLPETLTRPGRIDKKIAITNPTYSSRVEILKLYAEKSSCRFEITMEEIAKITIGFSCAALETLINECVLQSDENGFVSKSLVYDRLSEIKNEDITREKFAMDEMIEACCNIGSFVVSRTLNSGDYVLNLDYHTVCNNRFDSLFCYYDDEYMSEDEQEEDELDDYYDNDYDDNDYDDDDCQDFESYFSKEEYLNAITARLAGYACEEVILHKTFNNTISHFALIDTVLLSMADCGMFGVDLHFSYRRQEKLSYSKELEEKLNQVFAETISSCYQKAKSIIEKNVDLIRKLIPILIERKSLDKASCEPILLELGGIQS